MSWKLDAITVITLGLNVASIVRVWGDGACAGRRAFGAGVHRRCCMAVAAMRRGVARAAHALNACETPAARPVHSRSLSAAAVPPAAGRRSPSAPPQFPPGHCRAEALSRTPRPFCLGCPALPCSPGLRTPHHHTHTQAVVGLLGLLPAETHGWARPWALGLSVLAPMCSVPIANWRSEHMAVPEVEAPTAAGAVTMLLVSSRALVLPYRMLGWPAPLSLWLPAYGAYVVEILVWNVGTCLSRGWGPNMRAVLRDAGAWIQAGATLGAARGPQLLTGRLGGAFVLNWVLLVFGLAMPACVLVSRGARVKGRDAARGTPSARGARGAFGQWKRGRGVLAHALARVPSSCHTPRLLGVHAAEQQGCGGRPGLPDVADRRAWHSE